MPSHRLISYKGSSRDPIKDKTVKDQRCVMDYEKPEPPEWDCPDIDIDIENDGPLTDDGAEPVVERFGLESLLVLLLI